MMSDKFSRLLLELSWLTTNKRTSFESFCKQFSLDSEQAKLDLETLTYVGPGQFGGDLVDIQFDEHSISVVNSQGMDKPLNLNLAELSTIFLALQYMIDSNFEKNEAEQLRNTLLGLFEENTAQQKMTGNEIKQIIDEAIEKQKFIEIEYQDFFNKITKERRVFPLRIENQSGQIYLESIDLELNESRSFRFDRIIAVKTKDRIDVKASIEHLPKQGKVTLTFANWQLKILPKIEWKILTQNRDNVTVEIDYYDLDYVVEILLKLSSDFRIDCLEVEKEYIKKQLELFAKILK